MAQTSSAMRFTHIGGHHRLGDVRVLAIQETEELETVDHGHVNVHHDEVDLPVLQDLEGHARIGRGEDFPLLTGNTAEDRLDDAEEIDVIIDEENAFGGSAHV